MAVAEEQLQPADAGDLQLVDADIGVDQGQRAALTGLDAARAGAALAQGQAAQAAELTVRPEHFEGFLRLAQADFAGGGGEFPYFLLGFLALFGLNSLGWLPAGLREGLVAASQICLLLAMAALGMRTSLGELLAQGWKPFLLLVLLSAGLLLTSMTLLALLGRL